MISSQKNCQNSSGDHKNLLFCYRRSLIGAHTAKECLINGEFTLYNEITNLQYLNICIQEENPFVYIDIITLDSELDPKQEWPEIKKYCLNELIMQVHSVSMAHLFLF